MSNKDIEDWEKKLKNTLNVHKEPTNSKDLETFMNKLEQNNYFVQTQESSYWKWLISGSIFLSLLAIWYMSAPSKVNTKGVQTKKPTIESPKKSTADKKHLEDVKPNL